MSAEASASHQPRKDQEVFQPQFGFTKDITRRFQEAGLDQADYEEFTRGFDAFLFQIANSENLIALGVLAVSSSEGGAGYLVDEGGFVMDAIGYWSQPQAAEYDTEWMDLLKKPAVSRKIAPAFFQSYSLQDYPSLEAFQTALEDSDVRRNITLTHANCEFWGFVTTEQLREEMGRFTDIVSAVDDKAALTHQGQQHIMEAVQLAGESRYPDTYPRIASFLRNTGLYLPVDLEERLDPTGWRESLWERVHEENPRPYIEGLEDGVDPTPILIRAIEEADKEIAESVNADPQNHELDLASADIGLTRVVGVAVDIGNFEMAESVIDRLKMIAQELGDFDDVVECLAYLGVAKIRKGLPEVGTEQPSGSPI